MPMCVDSRKWLFVTLLVAAMALVCGEGAFGFEFLEKRDCTLTFKARPPLHKTCVIQGGIQGGSLDVSIRTPVGWSNRRRGRTQISASETPGRGGRPLPCNPPYESDRNGHDNPEKDVG